jgi:hypothetical protein
MYAIHLVATLFSSVLKLTVPDPGNVTVIIDEEPTTSIGERDWFSTLILGLSLSELLLNTAVAGVILSCEERNHQL